MSILEGTTMHPRHPFKNASPTSFFKTHLRNIVKKVRSNSTQILNTNKCQNQNFM